MYGKLDARGLMRVEFVSSTPLCALPIDSGYRGRPRLSQSLESVDAPTFPHLRGELAASAFLRAHETHTMSITSRRKRTDP